MRKFISILLCGLMLISLSGNVFAQSSEKTEYADLFIKDNVIDIKINIDEADLKDMRDNPQNEEYHTADITIDGITVENIGIRTKGNMTLSSIARMDSDRYSYRIKFNKYVKGQKLLGLNELCLNSGYSDASYMREYLHYEILREMGVNVPETVYCNVYINNEYAGFYLAVEALDSSFVETEFDDKDKEGNLYKMDQGANLVYNSEENYTYADLKVGNDTEMTGLKSFIKALNEMPEGEKGNIEKYLNVESALKYIASNTVMSNYDSYNGGLCHNYYLYENKNGVFTVVPWDFNMSFGGNGGDTNIGIDTPINGRDMEKLPLINNLLAVDEYKEMYYGYIKEMMALLENFEDRVNELKAIIKPYVEKDTTAFYTIEEFEKATSKSTEKIDTETDKAQANNEATNDKMQNVVGQNEHGRGGPDFGSSKSIVDCIADRLINLQAQFDGTAEKSTVSENPDGNNPGGFFGEHGGGRPPENREPQSDGMPNGGPPEGMPQMPDGFTPPDKPNGDDSFPPPNNKQDNRPQGGGFSGEFGKPTTNADTVIRVHIDGHILTFNENPVLNDGTTLVGYRSVMEELGAEVTWDESTQTVTAVKDNTTILVTIGSDTAYVNGKALPLLKAPEIINGNTMIPVRFISEQLGMTVEWHDDTKLIEITSKK